MVELPFNATAQTCRQTAVNKRTRTESGSFVTSTGSSGKKKEDFIREQFVRRWETSEQQDFTKHDRWHGQMYPVFVAQLLYIKTLATGKSSEEFSWWSFYFLIFLTLGWELWKQRADGVYELQCKQVDGVQLHLLNVAHGATRFPGCLSLFPLNASSVTFIRTQSADHGGARSSGSYLKVTALISVIYLRKQIICLLILRNLPFFPRDNKLN